MKTLLVKLVGSFTERDILTVAQVQEFGSKPDARRELDKIEDEARAGDNLVIRDTPNYLMTKRNDGILEDFAIMSTRQFEMGLELGHIQRVIQKLQ